MQEHLYLPRGLIHCQLLRRILETQFLYCLEEDRRFVAAGVGEDRLAAGCEELRREIREGGGVLAFVENVGGENEVEGTYTLDVRFAPVEENRLGLQAKVRAGVVGREVEGGLVVVCRENFRAAGEGGDGWKSDTASQLNGTGTGEVAGTEVTSQGEGARPEFGPVREALVAVEVFLVDQVVSGDGMLNEIGPVPDFDGGLGQPCKAAQMGSESIQCSSAGGGGGLVGYAFLAFGCGESRYAVTPEDVLERFAGLVPDLARGAKGGVGDIADPACGAAGGPDLTVQDLDDVEDGDLLRWHRESVASVRPAAALYDVRPAKLAEDLLKEPLGDALAARDLSHPKRAVALVERELHQRTYRIFALLCKPQEIITACRTDSRKIVAEMHERRACKERIRLRFRPRCGPGTGAWRPLSAAR